MKRPLLLPLVPMYAAGLVLREMRLARGWEQVRRLWYPVISIGNLSTGGSGKTPLTIALARLLSARGIHVDVMSRGYGRTNRNAARVRTDGSAEEFGDEPLLIAREAGVPVYVAAERYEAGRLAEAEANESDGRARVHILDDGFQHRQLARDLDVLLVNREDWHDHLLPAGNLREGVGAARRATVLAIPAEDRAFEAELREWGWAGPVWRIRRRMEVPEVDGPVAAFCGIARPEQFFAGLKRAGVSVVSQVAFEDHHRYSVRDVKSLIAKARTAGAAELITTEKDEVRLDNLASDFPASMPLKTVRLHMELENEEDILLWLEQKLAAARSEGPNREGAREISR